MNADHRAYVKNLYPPSSARVQSLIKSVRKVMRDQTPKLEQGPLIGHRYVFRPISGKTSMNGFLKIIGGFVIVGAVASSMTGASTSGQSGGSFMSNIEKQVASDSVRQYEIVQRNGSKMDMCVHAGIVSAAFVQAKDEENYKIWNAKENSDCARAGLPR
jgi:hypothetical protein